MKFHLGLLLIASFLTACASKPVEKPVPRGYDAELTNYEYPFPVKYYSFRAQEQDLKMAYMDMSRMNEAGKVIVLLHGKNFSGEYYEDLAHRLMTIGYRVIMIDQIGFGKSTKPKNFQYTFQALALYTNNLLDSIGVKNYQLLGHSMGGMLATRMALMYPEKISKLFLIDPIGLEDWKTMTAYHSIDQYYQAELNSNPERVKKYQLESYYDNNWKPEYDRYIKAMTGWMEGPDYPLIAWNAALTYDMVFTQPVYYEFKLLKMPTVLVVGTRDKTALGKAWAPAGVKEKMGNYPQMGKTVAKMIPKSKLIMLKGLGHLPFIEAPDLFWKNLEKELK